MKPQRWLRLTSPHIRGSDVKRLQQALNKRLAARHRDAIDVDGDYGKATQEAVHLVLYLLGAPAHELDIGATTALQRVILDPSNRSKAWLSRAKARVEWEEKKSRGRDGFLKYCRTYVGKAESPRDSNRGPWLDPLLHEAGWNPPGGVHGPPYCGIGMLVGYRRAGLEVPNNWSYTPNIMNDIRAGRYGFRQVSAEARQPGDILLFKFPGVSNDSCDHTGTVEDKNHSIEFNTGPGNTGSQNNGGGCYRRNWADRRNYIVCIGRPPWHRIK